MRSSIQPRENDEREEKTDCSGLHNGGAEESVGVTAVAKKVETDRDGTFARNFVSEKSDEQRKENLRLTRGFSKDGHFRRITAKRSDVVLYPLQRKSLVE